MYEDAVIETVPVEHMTKFREDFMSLVASHKFHRTNVKDSLTSMFLEFAGEVEGAAYAKNFIQCHPYRKDLYWEEVFRYSAIIYGYLYHQMRLINSGIIARIQYDVMYGAL